MATVYQDIDISLTSHPSTKDILKLYDVDAAKFALKSLMLTNAGENLNDMFFGIGIRALQFEIITPTITAFYTRLITNQVKQYLPEISLEDVVISDNSDTGEVSVIIKYYVRGNPNQQTYSLFLERTR